MSTIGTIDELKPVISGLQKLLDDPHPGLATWVEMLGKHMDLLSAWWNQPIPPPDRVPMSESVIREMRVACRKKQYALGGTEYWTERAHKSRDPRCWWYTQENWQVSIRSPHNSHGDYYLSIGEPTGDSGWFCFLQDGQHSGKFLHLRHIFYFDELQAIVRSLTDLELCLNEQKAKEWLDK